MAEKDLQSDDIKVENDKSLVVSAEKNSNLKKTDKKKKVKKESRIKKTVRETSSELKKVNWPKFKTVVAKTGVVLAVILIFGAILLGIDVLLGWLLRLLQGS